jgi:hypothetical protein
MAMIVCSTETGREEKRPVSQPLGSSVEYRPHNVHGVRDTRKQSVLLLPGTLPIIGLG